MQFEQDTLEKVIQARNSAVAARGVADAADKENALTQTLGRLFALAENYPNLKANENVKSLMEELASTENRIGFARQFYNDIATRFNTAQQVFPDNFIAQAFKFQPVELFEIKDEAERAVPKVDLNLRPTGMTSTNLYDQQKRNIANTRLFIAGFILLLAILGLGADGLLYAGGFSPGLPSATLGALGSGASPLVVAARRRQGGPRVDARRPPGPVRPEAAHARERRRRDGDRRRPAEARGST